MKYLSLFDSFLDNFFLNESNVIYSVDFKKILMKMNHPLAKELLGIEGVDKPVQSNYFDVKGDSNDSITFITDRKYKEIAAKINWGKYSVVKFDVLSPTEANRKYYQNLDIELPTEVKPIPEGELGEVGKMWTSPTSGKVWCKFIPDNKEYDPVMINIVNLKKMWDDSVFFNQNRQDIRIGRGVRGLLNSLGVKFTDKDIEEFVNKWKSTVDRLNDIFSNFEIVSGTDIAHWYRMENYLDPDKGTLGNSCMRDVDSDYFDIYVYNKKVEMVIYKSLDDPDKIVGRAIVWTLDDGKKFMDRIYTQNDSDVELFRQYAKEKGFYSKSYNGSSQSLKSISPDGSEVNLGEVEISLTTRELEKYPYLDTFAYYNMRTGIISNKFKKGFAQLTSTDGYYNGDPDDVEEEEDEEEELYVHFYSRSIPLSELVYCGLGDVSYNGTAIYGYRYLGDCVYNNYYSSYVANDLMTKKEIGDICSVTGQWRLLDDLDTIWSPKDTNKFIIKDYTGGDYKYSIYHDKWIPSDLAVEVVTNRYDGKDYRVKTDKSFKEVDGVLYDKGYLIKKDLDSKKSNESRFIKSFSKF